MSLEVIGDLILLTGIISGGILFVTVNVNYEPDNKERAKDESR